MNGHQELTYTLELGRVERRERKGQAVPKASEGAVTTIPRIARLMALAIRLDGLVKEKKMASYAEVARHGRVTRPRMTQIMKLLDLAPDIQEQLLFLPPMPGLTERNLRPIAQLIEWEEQRRLFRLFMISESAAEA